jgi:hypothetical protein
VPALPLANGSIASECGSSVGESSDDELDCSTDLLEATLVVVPAVTSALQAFTATQNGVKTQGASSNVAYRKMPQASLEIVRCERRLASAIAARLEANPI